MVDRRPLIAGVKLERDAERAAEEQFIYGDSPKAGRATAQADPVTVKTPPPVSRLPVTSRVRADIAQALKRASLERQLQGIEPNTVQDILEAALEPWLKANGYLS